MGSQSLLGVSFKKTVQLQGKHFTSSFLQAAVGGPILGIDFLRKFKVPAVPEISQIQFASTAAARPPRPVYLVLHRSYTPGRPSDQSGVLQ